MSVVSIGCDHGGFALKQDLIDHIKSLNYTIIDHGTFDGKEKAEYPDVAPLVCNDVLSGKALFGIVICGTGIGISIACNKIDGIRCALCHDHYTALMCRQHNNANVLALGGRTTGIEVAKEIVSTYLLTEFSGAHHTNRVEKLTHAYLNKC